MRKTTKPFKDFLKIFIKVHNNKYTYLENTFMGNTKKMKMVCPIHGEFLLTPYLHSKGIGCNKCGCGEVGNKLRITYDKFIKKAIKKHGNKFKYIKETYVNYNTKMKIICPKHGEFLQTPSAHLKYDCMKCSKKLPTNEELIKELKQTHNNKYEYKINSFNKISDFITIICPEHGEFKQRINIHKLGSGCPKCFEYRNKYNQIKPWKETIKTFKKIHGNKYKYDESSYIDNSTKMKIYCNEHKIYFEQTPAKHKKGTGCPECQKKNKKKTNKKLTKPFEKYLKKFRDIHGNKYQYDGSTYKNSKTKMRIICPNHGEFWQTPATHKIGCGCPKCKTSKGENKIEEFLKENKILYVQQKIFKDCKYRGCLKFDFYLPEYNICIEFNGEQHYKYVKYIHGSYEGFKIGKLRDKIKINYCFVKKIKLITIKFNEDIIKSLNKELWNIPKLNNTNLNIFF